MFVQWWHFKKESHSELYEHLFVPQLEGYENDFKIERQEKVKALSDRDQASRERDQMIQRYEHLKQEHIGLRQNIEQMYSEAQKQVRVIHLFKFSSLSCSNCRIRQFGRIS